MHCVGCTGTTLLGFVSALACLILISQGNSLAQSAAPAPPDLNNGRTMFFAGGCASCHAAPATAACDNPKIKDKFTLAGGRCLKTPFGTFYAPNISPDNESGIGGWSNTQFIKAFRRHRVAAVEQQRLAVADQNARVDRTGKNVKIGCEGDVFHRDPI